MDAGPCAPAPGGRVAVLTRPTVRLKMTAAVVHWFLMRWRYRFSGAVQGSPGAGSGGVRR